MKKAAVNITMSMNTAPPMIPPISGVVRPLDGVPKAAVFDIADASGEVLATTPRASVGAEFADPITVAETIVVVIVCGFKLASVVVVVSTKVKVVVSVE